MKLKINNKITCQDIPQGLMAEIENRLSFVTPKWDELSKRGYWTGETPRILKFYEVSDNGSLATPRGFITQLLSLCKRHGVQYGIEDRRRILPEVDFQFQGELRPFQQEAVKEILEHCYKLKLQIIEIATPEPPAGMIRD